MDDLNEEACRAAHKLVNGFVDEHGSDAVPTLVAACAAWAVATGRGNLIRTLFKVGIRDSQELEDRVRRSAS